MSRKKVTDEGTFLGFSPRLRKIRGGLSQEEFGKIFGVTKITISRYEAGRIPDVETLKKFADYGEVSIDWLLRGKEVEAEAPQLREHAPDVYDARPAFLDKDALAHIIFLARDWLRRKREKLSVPGEADLIARLYDHWLIEHIYPDDQDIAAYRGLVKN